MMRRALQFVALLCVAGCLLALSGCATTDRESDLPWNMTQPWETAPTMPFGSGGY